MFIGDYRQAFDYLENEIVKTGKRAGVVTNRFPTGWYMLRLGEWCDMFRAMPAARRL